MQNLIELIKNTLFYYDHKEIIFLRFLIKKRNFDLRKIIHVILSIEKLWDISPNV